MADPYQAGQVLGTALFGNTQDTYTNQLGRQYQVDQALQQARQARSKAILAQQVNDQRAMITPELLGSYRGGDEGATNQLIAAGLLGRDDLNFDVLGDIEGASYNRQSAEKATLGDWNGANAAKMYSAKGPVELAAVQGQNLIRNQYLEGGGGITTTEQGRAGMAADAARARASDASAASSYASAARTRQGAGLDAAKFALARAGGGRAGAAGGSAKPLPVGALKELLSVEEALGGTQVLNDIISKNKQRLESGALKVGPLQSVLGSARTTLGMSSDADVALSEWNSDLTKIVNESLRLNKGVQTEGDAQRAANELMNARDEKTIRAALGRLEGFNNRAIELQRRKEALVNSNYGRESTLGDSPVATPVRAQGLPAAASGGVDELLGKYGIR